MDKFKKVTLYGVNPSCPCGCIQQTHIFKSLPEAEAHVPKLPERYKIRIEVFEDCEDLEDERFIWNNRLLSEGHYNQDIEGNYTLKVFDNHR